MSSRTKTTATKEEAEPLLVPRLRFPEFRGAEPWMLVSGGSLFEQINDRNPEPGLPVLAITQEHGAIPRDLIDYHVSVTEKSIESYKVVRVGDFIISLRSFQGGIEYSRHHGICSPAYVILRRRGKGSDEYFRHYLKTHRFIRILTKNLEGLRDGKMVSYTQFSELLLPVPKSHEQQKIAECLSSVDELMAAQARKVDALKTHKKGLMQQLFPHEGETQPRHRFREFQNVGDWEATTLGQQAKLVRGPFGGSLKKEIFVASGYAVYEQQHAIYSDFSSFRYHITAEKFYELRRFVVAAGDIIMSCSGTMGRFAIVPDGAVPGVINQALLKLTPNGFCSTKFLKEVLELPSVQEKLLSQSAGGAIKNVVSVDQIKALPLRLPGAEEQRAVVGCVSTLDDLITAETQKLDAFKTHKKGLMQQLFPSPEAVEV